MRQGARRIEIAADADEDAMRKAALSDPKIAQRSRETSGKLSSSGPHRQHRRRLTGVVAAGAAGIKRSPRPTGECSRLYQNQQNLAFRMAHGRCAPQCALT